MRIPALVFLLSLSGLSGALADVIVRGPGVNVSACIEFSDSEDAPSQLGNRALNALLLVTPPDVPIYAALTSVHSSSADTMARDLRRGHSLTPAIQIIRPELTEIRVMQTLRPDGFVNAWNCPSGQPQVTVFVLRKQVQREACTPDLGYRLLCESDTCIFVPR